VSIQAIHKGVGVSVQGVEKVLAGIKKASIETEKSLNTAVRVEGYRLKGILQKEIRSGSPGGMPFAPLSFIARRLAGKRPGRKALNRLAMGIRYQVASQSPFVMAVGWVGPETGFDARMALQSAAFGRGIKEGHVVSKSWRRIAFFQQEGFTRPITEKQRRFVIHRGGGLGKVDGGSTPFFLRKSTKSFRTPSRPIITPFWNVHRPEALKNIKQNFKLKLGGQRI